MKPKHLIILLFALLVLEMGGEVVYDLKDTPFGIWTFKPFLMPVLMFWYFQETKANTAFDKIILVSLFFSWWGDNFLMPAIFETDVNFLLGLGSFLIAHVLYIAGFVKTNLEGKPILKSSPYLILPFVLFVVGLMYLLFQADMPGFREMSVPVMVYATVIMVMALAAINRKGRVNPESFNWVLVGALSFMLSDTLIALSRFTTLFGDQIFIARLMIMPLYVLGQYGIAKGCVLQHKAQLS
jgi:uncharacterized membrane protein YhhN